MSETPEESWIDGSLVPETASVSSAAHTVPQVRPWIRYWARCFDLFLFSFLVGYAIAFIAPTVFLAPEVFITFLVMQMWVFQESILLSTWGATPGKWLFAIKLRNADGNKLSLPNALGRSFAVWLKGCGLGIPIIALFTQLNARSTLKRTGATSWDTAGGYVVTHGRIGVIKGTLAVVFFTACFLLIAYGNAIDERMPVESFYEESMNLDDQMSQDDYTLFSYDNSKESSTDIGNSEPVAQTYPVYYPVYQPVIEMPVSPPPPQINIDAL